MRQQWWQTSEISLLPNGATVFMDVEGIVSTNVPPKFLRGVDFFITFDAPENPISEPVQAFVGWFAATKDAFPEVYVNNQNIHNISYYERDDVSEFARGSFNRGLTFYLDVARYMAPGQGSLKIEIVWDGRLVERKLYRIDARILSTAERELVAFIHVPKSGGTSLRRALEQQSVAYKILPSYEDHGFLRISDLQYISKSALQNYDAVFGHFQYGIHVNFGRKTRYISMIRNPYDLIISYYFYAKGTLKLPAILACSDIYEAVRVQTNVFFDNITTRMFAGLDDNEIVDETVYERAVANIDKDFEFVGILESPVASFSRIGAYLGLEIRPMTENVTPNTKEYELLDMAKFRAFSNPYIRFDLALYEYVLNKFWGAGSYAEGTA